jgi:hypothetical protein
MLCKEAFALVSLEPHAQLAFLPSLMTSCIAQPDYAYVVNPYLEATNPAPIATAKEWGNNTYTGKYGPLLSLTQVHRTAYEWHPLPT